MSRTKRNKIKVVSVLLAIIGFAVVLMTVTHQTSEPSYKDKKFSEYLSGFSQDGFMMLSHPPYRLGVTFSPSPDRTEALTAVRTIGDDSIPTLIRLASRRVVEPVEFIKKWLAKVPFADFKFRTGKATRHDATVALVILGTHKDIAAEDVTKLTSLLRRTDTVRTTVYALAHLRPNGTKVVRELSRIANHTNSFRAIEAMAALGHLGEKAREAESQLLGYLSSTNNQMSAMAAVTLVRIGVKSPELVDAISENLSKSSSQRGYPAPSLEMNLWALGELGTVAKSALPAIAPYLSHASESISQLAKESEERIRTRFE